jgi:hydroxyacylglutathione hydrolase
MIFKQFVLETLGHASYLIGSEQTGEAMVLDVRRDVATAVRNIGRPSCRSIGSDASLG